MWSWLSRGFTTMSQLATWHFDGDIQAAKKAMERTPDRMNDLYHLDEIPDPSDEVGDAQESALVAAAESKTLEGESCTFWTISDGVSEPIPLPDWFQLPSDNILLTWKREHEIWERRKAARLIRGKDSLPPKSQRSYDQWKAEETRVLVLDKKRKAVVTNVARKNLQTLKKTCLLLMVHPATDPQDLWIQAGDGKQWLLKLMKGQAIPDAPLPMEVDHFPGMFCFICLLVRTGCISK